MTRYREWYAKNKDRVAERRRARYHSDPDFRARVNARNRDARKKTAASQRPPQYTLSIREVGQSVEAPVTAIRWWITAGYIPRPKMFNGKFWFTEKQVDLIHPIATLFAFTPEAKDSPELQVLKDLAWLNWES